MGGVGGVPAFANFDDQQLTSAAIAETPGDVVLKVMNALRNLDDPYPLHGCEVAIRYCSPSNRASRLSPKLVAQYLSEPWYCILTEWDEIELEEPRPSVDTSDRFERTMMQDVLVRRKTDESWTIVSWKLSCYAGRWLTDSLSIT